MNLLSLPFERNELTCTKESTFELRTDFYLTLNCWRTCVAEKKPLMGVAEKNVYELFEIMKCLFLINFDLIYEEGPLQNLNAFKMYLERIFKCHLNHI